MSRSAAVGSASVSAKNSKSPLSEPIKRSSVSHQPAAGSDAVEKDKTGFGKADDGKPGSGPVKKTASPAAGKDVRPKRCVLHL